MLKLHNTHAIPLVCKNYFKWELKFLKYKLLTLYILLMQVIEYYFYVNWNILIEVWNINY